MAESTMSLRPLANALAVREPDPSAAGALERTLCDSGRFAQVSRPADGWIVGVDPLPGSAPDPPEVRERGFRFLEGRDRLEALGGGWLERLERICEHDPRGLLQLPGDFAFLRFSADGGVLAVRSCAGLVPIYATCGGVAERPILATRLADLAAMLTDPRPDLLVAALWIGGLPTFPAGRSLVQGARLVGRGSFLRSAEIGSAPPQVGSGLGTRYWDPRPADASELRRDPGLSGEFRELLLAALERDLPPGRPTLLALSGGADSASLAALAAGELGRPLWSLSFVARDPELRRRTSPRLETVAARYRFARRIEYFLDDAARAAYVRRSSPAALTVTYNPILAVLPEVLAGGRAEVLLGGEFADEVCGSRRTLPDWAAHATASDALHPGRWPTGPRDPVRWSRHRLLSAIGRARVPTLPELPPLFADELREEHRRWLVAEQERAAADSRPLTALAVRIRLGDSLVANWELCSLHGVRRSAPFFSRELLELAFAAHPAALVGPGPKLLLRRGLQGIVPAELLARAGPNEHLSGGLGEGRWAGQLPDDIAPLFDGSQLEGTLSGPSRLRVISAAKLGERLRWAASHPLHGAGR